MSFVEARYRMIANDSNMGTPLCSAPGSCQIKTMCQTEDKSVKMKSCRMDFTPPYEKDGFSCILLSCSFPLWSVSVCTRRGCWLPGRISPGLGMAETSGRCKSWWLTSRLTVKGSKVQLGQRNCQVKLLLTYFDELTQLVANNKSRNFLWQFDYAVAKHS